MTTTESPIVNNDLALRNIKRWIDRLKKARVFRKLQITGEMNEKTGDGWVKVTVHDGMTTLSTKPLSFTAATMTFERLYAMIKEDLMAVFSAHLDKMMAPELVLPGTVPVDVNDAETDDDPPYAF
jgi:hypothetical protein